MKLKYLYNKKQSSKIMTQIFTLSNSLVSVNAYARGPCQCARRGLWRRWRRRRGRAGKWAKDGREEMKPTTSRGRSQKSPEHRSLEWMAQSMKCSTESSDKLQSEYSRGMPWKEHQRQCEGPCSRQLRGARYKFCWPWDTILWQRR